MNPVHAVVVVAIATVIACLIVLSSPIKAAELCGEASWYGQAHHGKLQANGRMVVASWYGRESGNTTADGTSFTGREILVAHKTLPFGALVRLTYNGRSVTAPVRDRGPFIAGREVDVSEAVADLLGMKRAGVVRLCMEVL